MSTEELCPFTFRDLRLYFGLVAAPPEMMTRALPYTKPGLFGIGNDPAMPIIRHWMRRNGTDIQGLADYLVAEKKVPIGDVDSLPLPRVAELLGSAPGGPNSQETLANHPSIELLSVFSNGVSDDRIKQASQVLTDNKLSVNEKLWKIDALIPFPPTASAKQLGKLLGVTKQAILKTDWWIQKRKGEKQSEIGRRRSRHEQRAKEYESAAPEADDD